ncbi:MAG: hypothetical protein WA208_18575 [Thermoanaerobaculia bacterium]
MVAALAIVVSVGMQIAEWRRARFSRGLDVLGTMDARWDSAEFRETRRQAAADLLDRQSDPLEAEAVRDVLNFFETLGFLLRKEVVEADAVWHYFGSWLLPYTSAAASLTESYRAVDPNCLTEIEALVRAVWDVEIERNPQASGEGALTDERVRTFLEKEGKLSAPRRPMLSD